MEENLRELQILRPFMDLITLDVSSVFLLFSCVGHESWYSVISIEKRVCYMVSTLLG